MLGTGDLCHGELVSESEQMMDGAGMTATHAAVFSSASNGRTIFRRYLITSGSSGPMPRSFRSRFTNGIGSDPMTHVGVQII